MQFSAAFLAVVLPILAAAQNQFKVPPEGYGTLQAGSTITLSWTPTTGGTVNILLRSGPARNLGAGTVLASDVQNSGSTSVTIPSNVANSNDYAFEIVDSSNENINNFAGPFTIAGGSGTASSAASSAATTAMSSSTGMQSSTRASSASTSMSSPTPTSASTSAPATTSGPSTMTSSMSRTSATSSTAAQSTLPTGGAGALPTAAPFLAGAMALGAFIL